MSRHLDALGSLAISDKDLTRIEKLARELKDNAWSLKTAAVADAGNLLARADKTASKVSTAVVVGAIVTGISTVVVVKAAMEAKGAR